MDYSPWRSGVPVFYNLHIGVYLKTQTLEMVLGGTMKKEAWKNPDCFTPTSKLLLYIPLLFISPHSQASVA